MNAWLEQTDPELDRAWTWLGESVRRRTPCSRTWDRADACPCCGEVWQYMGSHYRSAVFDVTVSGRKGSEGWVHSFRHLHPVSNGHRNYEIWASAKWKPKETSEVKS